ncbi:J domain-containing protein [Halobacteriales archaeon Cl-PHB]
MHRRRLVTGLTVAFAIMTAALFVVGVAANPIGFVLAAVFALVTGLLWYQASGRLASRVYRRVEQQAATSGTSPGQARRERRRREEPRGGFGAGPKEGWTGPRRGQRGQGPQGTGPFGGRRQRRQRGAGQNGQRGSRQPGQPQQTGLSARQAAKILGVEPGADESTVKAAYRDRIKQVHPDTESGDEERFRKVQAAYERLSD